MNRFARLVASVLGAPVGLVSLVDPDGETLPGMIGLGEPWVSERRLPLSHGLGRLVVADGGPVVLEDARVDPGIRDSGVVRDLGVVGVAGWPLTDDEGQVLGALCAIDTRPRVWSGRELDLLEDLAAACSAELRLRIVSGRLERTAEAEAVARGRADVLAEGLRTTLGRSQLLLVAADALADTSGLDQVRQQLRDLVTSDLKPAYVGLVLAEAGERMRRVIDPVAGEAVEADFERFRLEDGWPSAQAARTNRTVVVNGLAELERDYSPQAADAFSRLGLACMVCVPLRAAAAVPLGALVLGWDQPHEIDVVERAVLTALAGFTARAVERALYLDSRVSAARMLQEAMLTDLPVVPGLELAGLYRPSAAGDLVGGDWYDAYVLPSSEPRDPGGTAPATLAVSVGDITGHDMHAATVMGQVRSMLRQADLDHPGQGPDDVVAALERANLALNLKASGTLIHAHLRPCPTPDNGEWELTWTNGGHPPPLVILPDGTVQRLDEHNCLLHPAMTGVRRTAQKLRLSQGSLLLLYTDGLVERPGVDLYAAIDAVGQGLTGHAERGLSELLVDLADRFAGPDPRDDIAMLALRIPGRRGLEPRDPAMVRGQ